jgi:hypothetical protein
MVLKFKEKRDLHMLSTKHTDNMVIVPRKGENKLKPEVVLDYNRGKSFIDFSDQMASYGSPLRKSLKWYHKVIFEFLLNTSVVNALCLFQKTTATNIKITDFRSNLIKCLTFKPNINQEITNKHVLTTASRNRCVQCYFNIAQEKGRKYSQSHCKKVTTKCFSCNKQLCVPCFFYYTNGLNNIPRLLNHYIIIILILCFFFFL